MGLMTPVLKAYFTDKGFKICSDAMQVHGGSGFTEHFPASQYLRDVRISMIYEGTNGIQALDLVGRKLPANGGRAVMGFFADVDAFTAEHAGDEALAPFVAGLVSAKAQLQEATGWLMRHGLANPDDAGAASTDYLHLFAPDEAWPGCGRRWSRRWAAPIAAGSDDRFLSDQAGDGALFPRTHPARGRRASGQAQGRRREPDGAGRGGVLSVKAVLQADLQRG